MLHFQVSASLTSPLQTLPQASSDLLDIALWPIRGKRLFPFPPLPSPFPLVVYLVILGQAGGGKE